MFKMFRVRGHRRRPSVFWGSRLPRQWMWVLYNILSVYNKWACFPKYFLCDYVLLVIWESMQLVQCFQAWKYIRKRFDINEIGLPFEIANLSTSLLIDMNESTNDWLIENVENECYKGRTRPNVGMIPCPWVEVLRADKGLVVRLVTHGTLEEVYHDIT